MRVGAAVGEGHELREGVGAFGAAEEGRGAALGCGDCGGGELGAAEEGAVETHFGCILCCSFFNFFGAAVHG